MKKAEMIREFLSKNPGAESAAIAEAIGSSASAVAAWCKQMFDRGVLRREPTSKTLSNVQKYGYWVADAIKRDNVVSLPDVERVAKPKKRTEPATSVSLDTIVSGFVDNFAATLADSIVAKLRPQLEERLKLALPAVLPKPPTAPEIVEEKARLPKVGVTGLLPQQAGLITTEFCETFELHFWNDRNGDGQGALRALAKCDAVFVHINHTSHTTENSLKAAGANIIRVPGGLTAMRDALTRYYVEEVAA